MQHPEQLYNIALELFESGKYDESIQYFIDTYNRGYEQELILHDLYQCFIIPNEEEFYKNYQENTRGIQAISPEDLAIDFIPVSEEKFYLFDKINSCFQGSITLKPLSSTALQEFHPELYAGIWDIRNMIDSLQSHQNSAVHIILNDIAPYFYSFFKLPRFRELYLSNVILHESDESMKQYFREHPDVYLPKSINASDISPYQQFILSEHEYRISHPQEHDNVFLSICVPSYNRGSLALANISSYLNSLYDSEIEVIISDNGSTLDVDGYDALSNSTDSRIRFYRNETNLGYAANVLKVLSYAKGKFAVLASDEDIIVLDEFANYMNLLHRNPNAALIATCGIGETFGQLEETACYPKGQEASSNAIGLAYLTGVTYQMDMLRAANAFEICALPSDNQFVVDYTHCALGCVAGTLGDFIWDTLRCWDNGISNDPSAERDSSVIDYMLPQTRIRQQNDAMLLFLEKLPYRAENLSLVFCKYSSRTYYLLHLGYQIAYKDFSKLYTWEEICDYVYEENKKFLSLFSSYIHTNKAEIMSSLESYIETLHNDCLKLSTCTE